MAEHVEQAARASCLALDLTAALLIGRRDLPSRSAMLSNLSSRAGELKSQGAVEASRDPNNAANPEDAEQVMVEESRKAGIAAFRFDPDASPEDKAAQARSVCSSTTAWGSASIN